MMYTGIERIIKIVKCSCVTGEPIHYIITAAIAATVFVIMDIAMALVLCQIVDMKTHAGYFIFWILTGVILVTVDRTVFRMFGYRRF